MLVRPPRAFPIFNLLCQFMTNVNGEWKFANMVKETSLTHSIKHKLLIFKAAPFASSRNS
jgi:hypothetical protein